MTKPTEITDWRKVKIETGQTVVFSERFGDSSHRPAEGIVDGFTPANRVWVNVIHRFGDTRSRREERIHIDPARLTVVGSLPETTLKTQAELNAEQKKQADTRKFNFDSHRLNKQPERPDFSRQVGLSYSASSNAYTSRITAYNNEMDVWREKPCGHCALTYRELSDMPCPNRLLSV